MFDVGIDHGYSFLEIVSRRHYIHREEYPRVYVHSTGKSRSFTFFRGLRHHDVLSDAEATTFIHDFFGTSSNFSNDISPEFPWDWYLQRYPPWGSSEFSQIVRRFVLIMPLLPTKTSSEIHVEALKSAIQWTPVSLLLNSRNAHISSGFSDVLRPFGEPHSLSGSDVVISVNQITEYIRVRQSKKKLLIHFPLIAVSDSTPRQALLRVQIYPIRTAIAR
jgi:hypothetical protein